MDRAEVTINLIECSAASPHNDLAQDIDETAPANRHRVIIPLP